MVMGRTERKVRQLLFDASLAELMSDEFKQRLVESMSESDKAKLHELVATRPHLNVLREEERMGLLGLYLIFLKLNPAFAEKYIRFLDNMFQLPDLNASLNQALDARMLAAEAEGKLATELEHLDAVMECVFMVYNLGYYTNLLNQYRHMLSDIRLLMGKKLNQFTTYRQQGRLAEADYQKVTADTETVKAALNALWSGFSDISYWFGVDMADIPDVALVKAHRFENVGILFIHLAQQLQDNGDAWLSDKMYQQLIELLGAVLQVERRKFDELPRDSIVEILRNARLFEYMEEAQTLASNLPDTVPYLKTCMKSGVPLARLFSQIDQGMLLALADPSHMAHASTLELILELNDPYYGGRDAISQTEGAFVAGLASTWFKNSEQFGFEDPAHVAYVLNLAVATTEYPVELRRVLNHVLSEFESLVPRRVLYTDELAASLVLTPDDERVTSEQLETAIRTIKKDKQQINFELTITNQDLKTGIPSLNSHAWRLTLNVKSSKQLLTGQLCINGYGDLAHEASSAIVNFAIDYYDEHVVVSLTLLDANHADQSELENTILKIVQRVLESESEAADQRLAERHDQAAVNDVTLSKGTLARKMTNGRPEVSSPTIEKRSKVRQTKQAEDLPYSSETMAEVLTRPTSLILARSKMNGSVQKKGRQAEMDQTVLQYIERYNEARGRVGGRYDYYKMLGVDEVVGPRGERVWRYKGIPGNPNLRLLVVAEKGTGRGVVVHYELRDTMYRQHNFQDIVTAQMAQHYEDR